MSPSANVPLGVVVKAPGVTGIEGVVTVTERATGTAEDTVVTPAETAATPGAVPMNEHGAPMSPPLLALMIQAV